MGIKSNVTRGVGSVFNRGARRAAALNTNMPVGMRGPASSRMAAKRASDQVVGRRVLTGGALLGGAGMMRNRDGSRGGYKGPRGSGRYA
jgi:hypothetical protein